MCNTILLFLVLLCFQLHSVSAVFFVRSTCSNLFPMVNTSGPGCSIPPFVDPEEFGDNLQSSGYLLLRANGRKTRLTIKVKGLSRPNYVLTAWIIWVDPNGEIPEIFNIASLVSPVTPTFGRFGDGLALEPNQLRNVGRKRAVLKSTLDYDITKPNSGPLVGTRPSFQSDIPGIEDTPYKQYESINGNPIPITANFLRVFDPETGFQKLNARGRPRIVRSPTKAYGIFVVAHIDKITHGLHPGFPDADHFEVVFFNLNNLRE